MDLHEYQAKELLKEAGIAVSDGVVVSSRDEARRVVQARHLTSAVVKAQVHAGGRGKAGGVKLAHGQNEILHGVDAMLQMRLVTHQTGSQGVPVHQVLLCPLVDIEHEYYMGAVIDRHRGQAVLLASPDGGVEIEEVAKKTPERLLVVPIRFDGELKSYYQMRLARHMGWSGEVAKQGMQIAAALAKLFIETDAVLAEMNPLVKTTSGDLLALDAKLSIDDNALFRHPRLAALYDPTQLPFYEAEAKKHDLAYIALEGDIGCMVNGAGLAMATMDIIQYYKGRPANFLDVGGGASQEKVAEGFKLILSDANVKAILVNIFGGIMNCVTLAGGIIVAAGQLGVSVPLVVRMEGNNVENGRRMLFDSGLNITVADTMAEAAQKAVAAAKGQGA